MITLTLLQKVYRDLHRKSPPLNYVKATAATSCRREKLFETTLASRSFAPWLKRERSKGYQIILLFLWLPSADFAVSRVKERVKMGGHHVPEDIIRRHDEAGLRNFFALYKPLADGFSVYGNSDFATPRLTAEQKAGEKFSTGDSRLWQKLWETYS